MIFLLAFFIISLVCSTNAFIFPEGYEIRYDYRGTVETTNSGTEFLTSRYEILAEIVIYNQGNGTDIRMQLDNVRYSAYVGVGSKRGEEVQPSEERKKVIQLPFILKYENGKHLIKVHNDDELWSVKMKESIVFILNINKTYFTDAEIDKININNDIENFGGRKNCFTSYHVTNKGDEYFVKKFFYPNSCLKPSLKIDLSPRFGCGLSSNEHHIERYFTVSNDDNGLYIKDIKSYASFLMYYNVFSASANHYVNLKSINKIEKYDESIENYVDVDSLSKIEHNNQKYVNKIKETLEIISNYIETMKIDLYDAIDRQQENIVSLLEYMKHLDEKSLLKIYEELNADNVREMFLLVLPVVGTKDSVLVVHHLILNKLINETRAIIILRNLPKTIISDKDLFVPELEDLTKPDNGLSEKLRNVATFAFASTMTDIYETLQRSKVNHFKKYVDKHSEKLIESKDYKEQFLSLNALTNMHLNDALIILENVVRAKSPYENFNPHLRALAALSFNQVFKIGLTDSSSKSVLDIMIPVFRNKMENLEVRLAALQVVMELSNPRMWAELYWHIISEENYSITHLYYSTLKNYAESDIDCVSDRVLHAKMFLNHIPKKYWKKGFDKIEFLGYKDSLNVNGFILNTIQLGDLNMDKFSTIMARYSFQIQGSIFDLFSSYIYIRLKDDFRGHVQQDIFSLAMMSQEDLSVEIITLKNNVIISADIVHPSYLLQIFTELQENLKHVNSLMWFENFDLENHVDFQIPMHMYFVASRMQIIDSEKIGTTKEGFSADVSFKLIDNVEYGLKIYNPLTDMKHGIRRVQKFDLLFDVNFDWSKNILEYHLKWAPIGKRQPLGIRSVGHTESYVYGDESEKILHQSCSSCKTMDVLDHERKNFTIWEYDDEITGLLYQFKIFDCNDEDIRKHRAHLKQIFKDRMKKLNTKSVFITFMNYLGHLTVSPGSGTCGIGFNMQSSKKYPVTHLSFHSTQFDINRILEPVSLSLYVMNDDTIVKSWNFTFSKYIESSRTQLAVKLKESSATSAQIETCIDVSKYYESEKYYEKVKVYRGEVCGKNKTVFSMEIAGVNSEDQDKYPEIENKLYEDCILDPRYEYKVCMNQATALRKYKCKIEFESFPKGVWKNLYYLLKDMYGITNYEESSKTKPGNLESVLIYPLVSSEQVDISIYGPFESFDIQSLLLDYSDPLFFNSPKSVFGVEKSSFLNLCLIEKEKFTFSMYTNVLAPCDDPGDRSQCKWAIYAKRENLGNGKMGMNIILGDEEIALRFEKKVQLVLKGEPLEKDDEKYHETNSIVFKYLHGHKTILIRLKEYVVFIGYDGDSIRILHDIAIFKGYCNNV